MALSNLKKAGLLDGAVANRLVETLDTWHALQGLLRLTVTAASRASSDYEMPKSLQEQVCRIIDTDNCSQAEDFIKSSAAWVHETFQTLVDHPAEPLRGSVKSDLQRATGK